MNIRKEVMGKTVVGLLLISLLWGCGQGGENIEKRQPAETGKQADETAQTEERDVSYDSDAFADATMKEKNSEACKGKPDKEHPEAITVLHLSLTKGGRADCCFR